MSIIKGIIKILHAALDKYQDNVELANQDIDLQNCKLMAGLFVESLKNDGEMPDIVDLVKIQRLNKYKIMKFVDHNEISQYIKVSSEEYDHIIDDIIKDY